MIEKEGPIHVSNVMLLDPKEGKPTRVGIEREERHARARRQAHRARSSTEHERATETHRPHA